MLNCSESSKNEEEIIFSAKINLTPDTEAIFENGNISLEEFWSSFLILQDELNLSSSQAMGVFEFVKSLFPNTHKLTSYSRLEGEFKSETPHMTKACLIYCRSNLL